MDIGAIQTMLLYSLFKYSYARNAAIQTYIATNIPAKYIYYSNLGYAYRHDAMAFTLKARMVMFPVLA